MPIGGPMMPVDITDPRESIVDANALAPCGPFKVFLASQSGLILGLRPANEKQLFLFFFESQRYFVTMSLIGWAETQN